MMTLPMTLNDPEPAQITLISTCTRYEDMKSGAIAYTVNVTTLPSENERNVTYALAM